MIDSHCHLDFEKLSQNFERVIQNSKKNNVTNILSINTNPHNFRKHLKIVKKNKGIYISYGLHPCEVKFSKQLLMEDFDSNCNNPLVIGIGETGIDLFHSQNLLKEQIEAFELHIEASKKYNLPLIIHQRNSEKEIIEVLNNFLSYKIKVLFHCFTGSENLLNFCLKNNFYISLSGIITFKNANKLRDIIKNYPLELILIETDSPFLAPEPMRGKTNEPSYIKYTAEFLSNFFELEIIEFEKITNNNFFKLFTKAKKDNQL
ncbi:TatD family hydrolase [Pelagibacteraceae bacterium]|nr:TatD family hydrolase [Pelagibacteraceae bacterium]